MAKQSVWSKILNWKFSGSNVPQSGTGPRVGDGPGGTVSEKIKPNPESTSFGEKVELMNRDYQIKFANFVLAANVAAVRVSISVEDGDGQKSETIQAKLQTLWERTVASMMPSIGFGRVAFEKSFDVDPDGPCTFIDKLEPIEFSESRLRLTDDHKFDGFEVRVQRNPDVWLPVEASSAWWLAIDATAKNPHGVSKYRGAVEEAWKTKAATMANRDMYVRRFAIRGGVSRGPETYIDERTGNVVSGAEMMGEAFENLLSGGQMFLPNTPHNDPRMADAGKHEWEFDEANVTALDPSPILSVIDKDDVAILRAFGIPEKAAIEGDGIGSFAQLSLQIMTLLANVDSIVAQWVASFQRYVVEPTRLMNYGDGPGPKFTINAVKLTNRPDSFVVTLLTALVANPQFAALILAGGVDLRNVLEQVGLPVSSEFEQIAQQVAARFQAVQGAVPGLSPAGDAGGPGEFLGIGRRAMTNTDKATDELIAKLKAGEITESRAQLSLEAIGWTAERAAKLIEDARDGQIDNPEFAGVTMNNAVFKQLVNTIVGESIAITMCGGKGGKPGPCPSLKEIATKVSALEGESARLKAVIAKGNAHPDFVKTWKTKIAANDAEVKSLKIQAAAHEAGDDTPAAKPAKKKAVEKKPAESSSSTASKRDKTSGQSKLSTIKKTSPKDPDAANFVDHWTGAGGGAEDYEAAKAAGAKWAAGGKNPAIDAVYGDTQAKLKAAGIKEVNSYRGIRIPEDHPLYKDIVSGKIKPGDEIDVDGNNFVSWSTNPDVASEYASKAQASTTTKNPKGKFKGIVLERSIPAEDIVSGSDFHHGFIDHEKEILAKSSGTTKLRVKAVH